MARRERMSAGSGSARPRIVIAGGGLAGLSLALALKQRARRRPRRGHVRSGPAARSARRQARLRHRGRGAADAAGARRLGRVAAKAQPILDMVITDSRLHDPVRPAFLTFAGEVEPGEPFAHMVEAAT